MGISNLLKELRPALAPAHVRQFAGQAVAVDASSWLYRGLYSCATEVATGVATTRYVLFVVQRARMLLHHGVTPILVFDGARTPLKTCEETDRYAARASNLEKALRLREMAGRARDGGEQTRLGDEADELFRKAIRITQEMVQRTVAALREAGVRCVVAPYEADPQLVHLCRSGEAAAVVTEDSDVLVYGLVSGRAPPVLFKLQPSGEAQMAALADLQALSGGEGTLGKFVRSLRLFGGAEGARLFVQMCVLAGCDYLASLRSVGLLTAHKLVLQFQRADPERRAERIVKFLARERKVAVPDDYLEQFAQAERVFLHHFVFDEERGCVPFTAYTGPDPAFLGPRLTPEAARGVAENRLHPSTLEELPPLSGSGSPSPSPSPSARPYVPAGAAALVQGFSPAAQGPSPSRPVMPTTLSFAAKGGGPDIVAQLRSAPAVGASRPVMPTTLSFAAKGGGPDIVAQLRSRVGASAAGASRPVMPVACSPAATSANPFARTPAVRPPAKGGAGISPAALAVEPKKKKLKTTPLTSWLSTAS